MEDKVYRIRHKITKEYLYTNKGAWLKRGYASSALQTRFYSDKEQMDNWEIISFTLVEDIKEN